MGKLIRNLIFTGLVIIPLVFSSCEKEPERIFMGEFTIDNLLYGYGPYYAIGYSFELGKEIKTSESPEPDITVHAKTDARGNVMGAYLDTPSLNESFALAAEFDSDFGAKEFYDELLEIGSYIWLDFADQISEHQVYVFRTRQDNYVKFRIKSLVLENTEEGAFAEVTIEWRIQPDGSTTFSK